MTGTQGKSFSSNLYKNRWTFFSDNWIYKTKNLGDPLDTSQSGHPGSHTPYLTSELITDKTCHSPAALQPSHQRFTASFAPDPISPWEPHFSHTMSVVLVTPLFSKPTSLCNQTRRTVGVTIIHPTSVPGHWRTYFLSNLTVKEQHLATDQTTGQRKPTGALHPDRSL